MSVTAIRFPERHPLTAGHEVVDVDRHLPTVPGPRRSKRVRRVPVRVAPLTQDVVRSAVDVEVVVPAFNESERLPATLATLTGHLAEQPFTSRVVIVDNGSSDDTGVTGHHPGAGGREVEVCTIGCSRPGKGAAVLRGLRTSRARYVVFIDADLSTPVSTLTPSLQALRSGAAAAVGSRHAPGARLAVPQPLGRRLGGRLFRALAGPVVEGVLDTQCGFKAFDREAVEPALWACRSSGFAFDVELLRRIQDVGGRIAELPVTWSDDARSTMRVRDGLAAVLAVARLNREFSRRAGGR
jgi:copper chaperone CopZ